VATPITVVAALVLTACGFNAQTNQQYQPAVGANHHGAMNVLNALLVANSDKTASLSAHIVNNTATEQALSSVTVATLDGVALPVTSTKSMLPLPKGSGASVGVASDAGGFRIGSGAKAGYYVRVTFTFTDASPITIEAPVVARTAMYDSVPG